MCLFCSSCSDSRARRPVEGVHAQDLSSNDGGRVRKAAVGGCASVLPV